MDQKQARPHESEEPAVTSLPQWQIEKVVDALCALAAQGATGDELVSAGNGLVKALANLNRSTGA